MRKGFSFFTLFNTLDVDKRVLVFKTMLNIIKFPVIRNIYDMLYWPVIRKKSLCMPKLIVVEPYNVCDLKCRMCPYPNMTREKVQMDMFLFKKIIDDAVGNGFITLTFSLYNEPLLDNLIFERVKYAKEKGLKVFFNTNGTMLTSEKMYKIIASGLDHIFFSVDAPTKEAYEEIRINANFDTTVGNIRNFIEYRSKIHSLTPTIGIASVGRSGERILRQMRKVFKGADIFVTSEEDNRRRVNVSTLKKSTTLNRLFPCNSIWDRFVVASSGKVFLCCADYDGTVVLGDLNNQTIKSVWDSNKFKKIRDSHLSRNGNEISLCNECDILYRTAPFVWWFI